MPLPPLARPRRRRAPVWLLALAGSLALGACASSGPPRGWAKDSREIHDGLRASERRLEGELLQALSGDAPGRVQARAEVEGELLRAYAPVLSAWTAFGDYSAAEEAALTLEGVAGARQVREAFHALHVALLESRLAHHYGIDADGHRALLQTLDRSADARTAVVLAADWAEHLATSCARHAQALEMRLQDQEAAAVAALRLESLDLRKRHADLRLEETRLAQLMRRRAAGVGEVEGDPARELQGVRTELKEVQAAIGTQDDRGEELSGAFQDARDDARLAIEGFTAWAAAHERMAAAVRDGRGSLQRGRLKDIADALAP